jgi:hypothetical protein
MPRDVVADLVPEHGGELCFGVQVVEQAAVYINVAASWREGVHFIVVEDEEFEVPACDGGLGGDLRADTLDVVLDGLVFVESVELDDFLVDSPGLVLLALN